MIFAINNIYSNTKKINPFAEGGIDENNEIGDFLKNDNNNLFLKLETI